MLSHVTSIWEIPRFHFSEDYKFEIIRFNRQSCLFTANVLGLEGKDIYIFRNSNQSDYREINLLMISENGINHYTAIKSLSRLLRTSNTKQV